MPNEPEMTIDENTIYTVTITTDKGSMVLELDPQLAPRTVNNFVTLAKQGYYDNLTFHRVEPGFVIQGGCPEGSGRGGPGYRFADEPVKGEYTQGAVAMANAGPDTNGSQFFITEGAGAKVPQLEPRACQSRSGVCGYTRFGEGVCGCDLVGKIARAGNSQTKLVHVIISSTPPTCQ